MSEFYTTVFSTSNFSIGMLDDLKKWKHNAFVGNTGDSDNQFELSLLLVPNPSIAQKCRSSSVVHELPDGST